MRGVANHRSGKSLDCDLGLYAHGILGRRKMKKASQSMDTKQTVPSVSPRAYPEFEALSRAVLLAPEPFVLLQLLGAMEDSSLGEQRGLKTGVK